MATLRYRRDVDGLRAVAILPVVLFHFGIPGFGGGFVGVDVFFVISGFLITHILREEIEQRQFSIAGFYERRVRRILPALFVMLACATLAACVLMVPDELTYFGKSLAATALFASNIEFWRETGYFNFSSESESLLHTWSLAVEEQFYVLYPVLIWLLERFARRAMALALPALLLASLAFSIWSVAHAPISAFYLLPSRFWELLLGGSLVEFESRSRLNGMPATLMCAAGAAMIAWAVFTYSPITPFPGLAALLPCGGAALIIQGGQSRPAVSEKLLGAAPMVLLGKMSYSLYLWHWPVIVFARLWLGRQLEPAETVLVLAASLGASYLSWRKIETPLRSKVPSRSVLFIAAAIISGVFLVAGWLLFHSRGIPARFTPQQHKLLAAADDAPTDRIDCLTHTLNQIAHGQMCRIGASEGSPDTLLWGDSHASAIAPGLQSEANKAGKSLLMAVRGACPPLLGTRTRMEPAEANDCLPFNNAVRSFVATHRIETVILAARWPIWVEGTGGPFDPVRRYTLEGPVGTHATDNRAVFVAALERTVQMLTKFGIRVVLVGDVPEIGFNVPATLARRQFLGRPAPEGPTAAEVAARQKTVAEIFAQVRREYPVTIIMPSNVLCGSGTCALARGGRPLYMDDNHLSRAGAAAVEPAFHDLFQAR